MIRRAGELAEDTGYHFLATGEVLNERPKSQNRKSLDIVAEDSGYASRLLRPLSAKLLPPTLPESEGWVDRDRLEAIQGRSRKRQFQLADEFGLQDFPTPAGGCRLTEPNFSRRLLDLKQHEGLHGVRSIRLLRVGRHFRLAEKLKLIVGRDEHDNAVIEGAAELYDLVLKPEDVPGPTGLLPHTAGKDQIRLSAAICARYSDAPREEDVTIRVRSPRSVDRLHVRAVRPEDVESLRI
jgi:tRNA U34 2-thiouridine synthase MnmA/TrmU